jgi:hypothetical protein
MIMRSDKMSGSVLYIQDKKTREIRQNGLVYPDQNNSLWFGAGVLRSFCSLGIMVDHTHINCRSLRKSDRLVIQIF